MKKILLLTLILFAFANVTAIDKYTYTEGTYNIEEPIEKLVIGELTFNNVESGVIQGKNNYNIIVSETGHQDLNLNNIQLEFYGKANILKTEGTFELIGDIKVEIDRTIGQSIKLNAPGYLKIFPDSSIEVENGEATFFINTFLTKIKPSFVLSSDKALCTLKKDSTYEVNNYLITALNPDLKVFSESASKGDYYASISEGGLIEAKGSHFINYTTYPGFELRTEAGTTLYFEPSSNSPLTIKTYNLENKEYFTIISSGKEFKVVNIDNIGHLKLKKSNLNSVEEPIPFIVIPLNINSNEGYANYVRKSGGIETIDSKPLVQLLGTEDVDILIHNSITPEPVGKTNKVFFNCEPLIFVNKETEVEKKLILTTTNCTSSADKSVEMDCIKVIELSDNQDFIDCEDETTPIEVIATIPISQKDFSGKFVDVGKPIYKDNEKRAEYSGFIPERFTTNKGKVILEIFRVRVDSADIIPVSYYIQDEDVLNYAIINTMRTKLKQGLYSSQIWLNSEEINEEALRELVPGINKEELLTALKWAAENSDLVDETEKVEFYNFLNYLSKPKENSKITGSVISLRDISISVKSFLSRLNLFPALRKKANTASSGDFCSYVNQCTGSDYRNCYICRGNKCIASDSKQNYYDACEKNCQCKRINYYDESKQSYAYYSNILCKGYRCVQRDTVLTGSLPHESTKGERCSSSKKANFKKLFDENKEMVLKKAKEKDIDPALIFAIAEQETCLGQESQVVTGAPKEWGAGWASQVESTLGILHRAFYENSPSYSKCRDYSSIEDRWKCIICIYGPTPEAMPGEKDVCNHNTPLEPNQPYRDNVYEFWQQWRRFIYLQSS